MTNSEPSTETEVLLAEMRHRFANSFQLLTGLIRMRMRDAESEDARRHLSWAMDMASVLAVMQQRLSGSGSADFDVYLHESAALWDRIGAEQGVTVTADLGDAVSIPDGAAPKLALAVHELVTNSIRHAFPDGHAGGVTIGLRAAGDGHAELTVSDTGPGRPDGNSMMQASGRASSGLPLVRLLVSDLGGTVDILPRVPSGTVVRTIVPLGDAPSKGSPSIGGDGATAVPDPT